MYDGLIDGGLLLNRLNDVFSKFGPWSLLCPVINDFDILE